MDIETLLKLQEEDRLLRSLKHESMVVLPARRNDAKKRLAMAQEAVKKAEAANIAAENEYKRFQHDYTLSHQKMRRAEQNASYWSSSRSVNAAQAEYTTASANAAQAEASAARAAQNLTPTERRLSAAQAFEAEEAAAVQKILDDLNARKESLEAEITRVQERVNALAETIEPTLLNYYIRVTMTRWPCIVELNRDTSVCSGCDMAQPVSVKQALIAEEKNPSGTLIYCPSCGRILY
ncbi:MAG: hypothetical protein IJV69_05180 [Kiritimatiellae bacterium]|nr:hypothetical protein [Kiritimatiellia bacterium]